MSQLISPGQTKGTAQPVFGFYGCITNDQKFSGLLKTQVYHLSFCRSAFQHGVIAFSAQSLSGLKKLPVQSVVLIGNLGVLAGCWQKPFPYGCRTEVIIFLLLARNHLQLLEAAQGSPWLFPACFSPGIFHLVGLAQCIHFFLCYHKCIILKYRLLFTAVLFHTQHQALDPETKQKHAWVL